MQKTEQRTILCLDVGLPVGHFIFSIVNCQEMLYPIIVEVRVLLNCMGFLLAISQRNVNQNKNLEPGEITQQLGALAAVQKMRLQFPAPT